MKKCIRDQKEKLFRVFYVRHVTDITSLSYRTLTQEPFSPSKGSLFVSFHVSLRWCLCAVCKYTCKCVIYDKYV